MRHQDDLPPVTPTSAEETSQTRFGPRPASKDYRRAPGPVESRRIPPHGDVSPDGGRPWPRPSRRAKWLVLGGTGLAAAALTAGTVIAVRHVLDLVSNDEPSPNRDPVPPRPANPHSLQSPPRQQEPETPTPPKTKPQPTSRPSRDLPRQNILQEVEANTASLTNAVENVMHTFTAALTGFRTVAGQASTIVQEFGDAAAMVRDIIDRKPTRPQPPSRSQAPYPDDRHGAHMPDLHDDPLLHDPMDGPDPGGPADHNPRIHRL